MCVRPNWRVCGERVRVAHCVCCPSHHHTRGGVKVTPTRPKKWKKREKKTEQEEEEEKKGGYVFFFLFYLRPLVSYFPSSPTSTTTHTLLLGFFFYSRHFKMFCVWHITFLKKNKKDDFLFCFKESTTIDLLFFTDGADNLSVCVIMNRNLVVIASRENKSERRAVD